ncbi:MAG: site-2 protease family protein [Promethearchaeota archaeon]|nr:MAG: site-2 protease family protein [Candidatus Lokiarchaeota archaeon]
MNKMKIGKVKGIEIDLHLSTLAIVGLVGFYAAQYYFSATGILNWASLIIVGLINGLIILGSIIAHELMHSIISLRHGLKVSKIELYMFGGVSNIEEEPRTPRSETIISAAGPAASLLIGGIFLALYFIPTLVFGLTLPAILSVTFLYSGISNTGLGVFNLVPAFPMDGGRVLRAYLWKKRDDLLSATETASKVGYYFGWVMVGYGFFQIIFLPGIIGGFWFIILGFFLSSSSRNAYQQTVYEYKLSKISAKEILNKPDQIIPFDMKIKDAIQQYFMNFRKSYFPVGKDDEIVGIVTIESIQKIPPNQRSELIIGKAMKDISEFPIISEDETAKAAFSKIRVEEEPKIIIVKDNGSVAGFITENEIQSAIRLSDLLFGEKI